MSVLTPESSKARITMEYAQIESEIEDNQEKIIISRDPSRLTNLIDRINVPFEHVKYPSTLTIDCRAFGSISRLAVSQTSSVNLGPMPVDFPHCSEQINRFFGNDLQLLGEFGLSRTLTAPSIKQFLYGLEDFKPVRKQRTQDPARRSRDAVDEVHHVVPRKEGSETNLAVMRAKRFNDFIEERYAVPIYKAIEDKESYAATVENAFDLSHLVRDGKVAIRKEADEYIATVDLESVRKGSRRRQCILQINYSDFTRITRPG